MRRESGFVAVGTCTGAIIHRCLGKISGPLLDHIDLHIEAPAVQMRERVMAAREQQRLLKVSRTLADIEGAAKVSAKHVAEAVQYRSLDRSYWGS